METMISFITIHLKRDCGKVQETLHAYPRFKMRRINSLENLPYRFVIRMYRFVI